MVGTYFFLSWLFAVSVTWYINVGRQSSYFIVNCMKIYGTLALTDVKYFSK